MDLRARILATTLALTGCTAASPAGGVSAGGVLDTESRDDDDSADDTDADDTDAVDTSGSSSETGALGSSSEAVSSDSTGPCVPACRADACGSDGCGGLCGPCEASRYCNEEEICVSLPDGALFWEACGYDCTGAASLGALVATWESAGATVDVVSSLPPDVSFDAYRIVVVFVPVDGLTAAQRQQLVEFYGAGGGLVLVGEQDDYAPFANANIALNGLLDELGLGDDLGILGTRSASSGCLDTTTDVNEGHPLMEGVAGVQYNLLTLVDAGPADIMASIGEGPILAGTQRVVVVGDSQFFYEPCGSYAADGNFALFVNLWALLV